MGFLFDIPDTKKQQEAKKELEQKRKQRAQESGTVAVSSNIKLKKGQSLSDLIQEARKLVMEKLGKYKDTSHCVRTVEELIKFFDETEDLIAIDCETTGLNTFSDELVGLSLCNGKDAIYVPMNHKSAMYNTRLVDQLTTEQVRDIFAVKMNAKNYKWLYHNAKFDISVFRTHFGFPMPDPYWDTMLGGNLIFQDEEHSLKYLYNKYIATEDEGVNKFDTLFKRSNI